MSINAESINVTPIFPGLITNLVLETRGLPLHPSRMQRIKQVIARIICEFKHYIPEMGFAVLTGVVAGLFDEKILVVALPILGLLLILKARSRYKEVRTRALAHDYGTLANILTNFDRHHPKEQVLNQINTPTITAQELSQSLHAVYDSLEELKDQLKAQNFHAFKTRHIAHNLDSWGTLLAQMTLKNWADELLKDEFKDSPPEGLRNLKQSAERQIDEIYEIIQRQLDHSKQVRDEFI